jgi:hypothetical protein
MDEEHVKDPTESKIFSTNVGPMYDCPYAPGSACSARKTLCDQGKFEVSCLMHILRNISVSVQASQDYLHKMGMEDAVMWLFDHEYIRQKYYNHSVSTLVDLILADLKKQRETEKRDRR